MTACSQSRYTPESQGQHSLPRTSQAWTLPGLHRILFCHTGELCTAEPQIELVEASHLNPKPTCAQALSAIVASCPQAVLHVVDCKVITGLIEIVQRRGPEPAAAAARLLQALAECKPQ